MGALPAVDLAADDALGVGHRDAPLAPLDEDDEGDDGQGHGGHEDHLDRIPSSGLQAGDHAAQAGRETGHDAGEDDQGDAVADAALRDLLAQPHDEDRARGQGQDGQELERQARVGHDGRPAGALQALQEEGDAPGLDDADGQRAVAGVLGDLLAAQLAFLGQPLQVGPDDRQQLQDDRGADVRHDAQGEDRHLRHIAAREQVDEAEDGALLGGPELGQGGRTDSGIRNLSAGPVDGQEGQGEDDPLAQLGDREDVADAVQHAHG